MNKSETLRNRYRQLKIKSVRRAGSAMAMQDYLKNKNFKMWTLARSSIKKGHPSSLRGNYRISIDGIEGSDGKKSITCRKGVTCKAYTFPSI